MRRSVLSSLTYLLALIPLACLAQQPAPACRGGRCVQVISGTARVGPQLRVNASGPVTLDAGVSGELSYTATVVVRARSEAEARRLLAQYAVRVSPEGDWSVLAAPSGPLTSTLAVRAPKLTAAAVFTTDGAVEVRGVGGWLEVNSESGSVTADRIGGNCQLTTRDGNVRVGEVGGALRLTTGSGRITVKSVGGQAVLQTMAGDIVVGQAGGTVQAETGAGTVRVDQAAGAVWAATGGGQIWVGDARGIVTTRNAAGPVRVDSATGVSCDSGAGFVQLGSISGSMRVATAMGSILASLLGGKRADSYLSTGNGDITVLIPSNVGVTIQAENEMADTARRIVSEFPQIPVRVRGNRVVAEGSVNGGGPVLRISAATGTIYIRRRQ